MSAAFSVISRVLAYPFILLILIYQWLISPLTPPSCRFYPSCSEYSKQSFLRFGVFRGLFLSARRVSKCHPGHDGGVDPVPEKPR